MRPYLLLLVMDVGVRFGVGVGVFFLCAVCTCKTRLWWAWRRPRGLGLGGVGMPNSASGGLLARRHETATETPRQTPRQTPDETQTNTDTNADTETPALSSSFLFPPARRGWSAFEVIVGRTARGSSSRSFLVSSSPPSFLFPRLPFLSFLFRAMGHAYLCSLEIAMRRGETHGGARGWTRRVTVRDAAQPPGPGNCPGSSRPSTTITHPAPPQTCPPQSSKSRTAS